MNKLILDFENNTIEWDTDGQKGTEICPDLLERRPQILAAMGYEQYSAMDFANIVNAFINGEISELEVYQMFEELKPIEP